ncbi:hypothetical protein F0Q45_23245 [Mycobacterium simiae]|uniref:Uncharacterized protein n=1 Tax=Mycobacterium simiae TaxID=1784 RepID=A0A5B1BHI9_MYCSI|nr:hypothetical protein F0Q45_23245 [Mycobacterium simiae]
MGIGYRSEPTPVAQPVVRKPRARKRPKGAPTHVRSWPLRPNPAQCRDIPHMCTYGSADPPPPDRGRLDGGGEHRIARSQTRSGTRIHPPRHVGAKVCRLAHALTLPPPCRTADGART